MELVSTSASGVPVVASHNTQVIEVTGSADAYGALAVRSCSVTHENYRQRMLSFIVARTGGTVREISGTFLMSHIATATDTPPVNQVDLFQYQDIETMSSIQETRTQMFTTPVFGLAEAQSETEIIVNLNATIPLRMSSTIHVMLMQATAETLGHAAVPVPIVLSDCTSEVHLQPFFAHDNQCDHVPFWIRHPYI